VSRTPNAVIVVFGAAIRADGSPSPALVRRIETAIAEARASDALILVTGGAVAAPVAEAAVMRGLLEAAAIAPERIVAEDQARSTLGSVRRCAPILRQISPERIMICSDGYHIPRCRWLMRLAGFRTEALPARTPMIRVWPRLREAIAIPVDTLCWLLGL
jgi:uncharacterized SAM-binding protein YcdF (DUF218 family)